MKRMFAAAALGLAMSAPALAEDVVFVTSDIVKDKPTVALDPARAYILLRSDAATPLHLMKEPSEFDRSAYQSMRAEAFAKARRKYEKEFARYEAARKSAARFKKDDPRARVPAKPVEPTEANFEFTPFHLMAGVSIGPLNRFAKRDGGASVYLQAVTSGDYRIYGPIAAAPNGGFFGRCFCMGSVKFEAKAGEITDMGTILTSVEGPGVQAAAGNAFVSLQPTGFRIEPAGSTTPLDPRLKNMTVRPAAYRPAGKLPNYFGLAIDRIPEMPGVMRYERDRIVDLTASAELAAGN